MLAPHLRPAEVYGRYRLQSVAGAAEEPLWVAGAIVYLDHRGDAGLRHGDTLRLGTYRVDPDARTIEITLYNTDSEYLHRLHRSDGREADRAFVPANAVSHIRGQYQFSSSQELVVHAEQPAGLVLRLSRDDLHWPQKHWYLHVVQSGTKPDGSRRELVATPMAPRPGLRQTAGHPFCCGLAFAEPGDVSYHSSGKRRPDSASPEHSP
jgi:hypothetical protein